MEGRRILFFIQSMLIFRARRRYLALVNSQTRSRNYLRTQFVGTKQERLITRTVVILANSLQYLIMAC